MRWVSSAVRLVSGDTSPLPPRPAVEPAAVTSLIAAAALRLNEGEINQTTDDMSRVRLDHGGVEAYAEHAAGKLEAEHPKRAFENPSHDRVSARRRGNFVEALPIDRTSCAAMTIAASSSVASVCPSFLRRRVITTMHGPGGVLPRRRAHRFAPVSGVNSMLR